MMRSIGRSSRAAASAARLGSAVEAVWCRALDVTEEGAGAALPRHVGELVDRRDHEGRQAAIDFLVDDDDRQPFRAGERAIDVIAVDVEPLRRRRRRDAAGSVLA